MYLYLRIQASSNQYICMCMDGANQVGLREAGLCKEPSIVDGLLTFSRPCTTERQTSAKSKTGFETWTTCTDPSAHSPQIIRATWLQCSTLLQREWCDHIITTFQRLGYSFRLIQCTCFFEVGPLDFNHFDSFLNCSIDIKNIPNYSIPWDIDYTQACTTTITKIETPRVNAHQISINCSNDYFKHRIE